MRAEGEALFSGNLVNWKNGMQNAAD